MKKIFILVFCTFILSACSVEYNVVLDDRGVDEELLITGYTSDEINNLTNYMMNENVFIDEQISSETNEIDPSVSYYKKEILDDTLSFSYNHKKSSYSSSRLLNTCYSGTNYTNNSEMVILSTTKEFTCFDSYTDLNKVVVNITIPYVVEDHNAFYVDGNVYTWIVDKSVSNNSIFIKAKKESLSDSDIVDDPNDDKEIENQLIYILALIVLFILIIVLLLNVKKNKSDY